jgi:peptidoglycan/LPS O-acetylase OafA/YrhL
MILILGAPVFRMAWFFLVPGNERIQYLATFSRMDVISLGCLLALGLRQGFLRISPQQSTILMLATSGILMVVYNLQGLNRMLPFCRIAGYSLVGLTFFSVVWWALLHRDQGVVAFLRFPPLTYLGKICYGVYLLQRPAEVLLVKGMGKFGVVFDAGSPSLMVGKMAFSILIASLCWYAFEKPLLSLKDRFVSKRHPSERSVPADYSVPV